jgi:hemerythrin-like domain-containing protein
MLTATYSLVAIAAEQNKTRSILGRLQQYVKTSWKGLQSIDLNFLETAFNKLMQFDKYCRGRKIEKYLIPALRNASLEAEKLIAELDYLSTKAASILCTVGEQLSAAFERGSVKAGEIYQAMEVYCDTLFMRLEKEDKELLPMARRLFSIEDWFSIAAQFLSGDTNADGQKNNAFSSSSHQVDQPASPMM